MDYTNPIPLERAAIHEAGHALVATCASRMPKVREVLLDPGGHSVCKLDIDAVHAALEATANDTQARIEFLTQSIAVCAAGGLAEWIAFGFREPLLELTHESSGSDARGMLRLADMIRELLAADPRMQLRASLKGPVDRKIEESLKLKISGAFDLAEFWLRTKWSAVEYLATRLFQCPAMPGDLVRVLIDTAPEKMRPLATPEQDVALMARAGAADSALGREMLRVLRAA